MIGGIVIETIVMPAKVWVNCIEREESSNSKCAVYCAKDDNSLRIKPGDSFWWQGGFCMWTPFENKSRPDNKAGVDYDIRIPKIGFSGVSRPPAMSQPT